MPRPATGARDRLVESTLTLLRRGGLSAAGLNDVVAHAQARAAKPLDAGELQRLALRAGAPIAGPEADRAARLLLAELSAGRKPRRGLRRLLADSVDNRDAGLSDAARAVQEWIGESPQQRGETLRELLLLADALPQRRRPNRIQFPRLGHS